MSPRRRVVTLGPSRALCGTTPEQFAELVERLAPAVEAEYRARGERPGRRRALGGGDKPLAFWFRLLVALTHLRQGASVRATAAVFGIHERSVRRYRDEVVALLADHGCQPPGAPRPLRTLEDLRAHLEALPEKTAMVDATEVARSAPEDWAAQRAAWSGKAKGHVVKGTLVADRSRRPLWFEANPSGEGRTGDVAMLRAQGPLLAALVLAGCLVLVDRGYQNLDHELGPRVVSPLYKPRGGVLGEAGRRFNRALSSLRMPVEHACGRMKWWRALRYWRQAPERFGATGKAVAVLASLT